MRGWCACQGVESGLETTDGSTGCRKGWGAKYRWLKSDIDRASYIWTYAKDAYLADFPLLDFPANGGYLTEIGEVYDPLLSPWPTLESVDDAPTNAAFEPQLTVQNKDNSSRATSVFDVTENQYGFYLMPLWKASDQLQVVGGLRAEYTDASSNGYAWLADQERAVPNETGSSYSIISGMNLYLELINLNNDPLRYYNGKEGDTDRPEQTKWYSTRGSLGIHWSLF